MKWRLASISLMGAGMVLGLMNMNVLPLQKSRIIFDNGFTGRHTEVSYYDLLSNTRECYQLLFDITEEHMTMLFISPDDPEFLVKSRLIPGDWTMAGKLFQQQILYSSQLNRHPMLGNILNFASNNEIVLQSINFKGKKMLITPSGQILSQQ